MIIDTVELILNEQTLKPWAKYVVNMDVQDFMENKSFMSRENFAEWFLTEYESAMEVYNAIKLDA